MRECWRIIDLGSISTVGSGNSAPQDKMLFKDGEHHFIRTSDVGKIRFGSILESKDLLNEYGVAKLKRYPPYTILIPKSGASTFLNHRVIMIKSGYVSSHLATVIPKPELVDPFYLLYYLSTVKAQDLVQDHAYPSLKLSDIKSIKVPLTSLNNQKQIVSILDKAFAAIDLAKSNIEKNIQNVSELYNSLINLGLLGKLGISCSKNEDAKDLLNKILKDRELNWKIAEDEKIALAPNSAKRGSYKPPLELRGDKGKYPELPNNWHWVSLDQLTYFIVDYRGKTPPRSTDGIPIISAANILNGKVVNKPARFVSNQVYKEWLVRGKPKFGDVIITTEAPVGRTAVYPKDVTYLLTRRVLAVRTNGCDPLYLSLALSNGESKKHINSHLHGATVPRIFKDDILRTPIPLPPKEEQIVLSDIFSNLIKYKTELIERYVKKLDALNQFKKSVLQKAFTGELTLSTEINE